MYAKHAAVVKTASMQHIIWNIKIEDSFSDLLHKPFFSYCFSSCTPIQNWSSMQYVLAICLNICWTEICIMHARRVHSCYVLILKEKHYRNATSYCYTISPSHINSDVDSEFSWKPARTCFDAYRMYSSLSAKQYK